MYQFPQQFVIVDWLLDYQEIHVLFAANIAQPGISVLKVWHESEDLISSNKTVASFQHWSKWLIFQIYYRVHSRMWRMRTLHVWSSISWGTSPPSDCSNILLSCSTNITSTQKPLHHSNVHLFTFIDRVDEEFSCRTDIVAAILGCGGAKSCNNTSPSRISSLTLSDQKTNTNTKQHPNNAIPSQWQTHSFFSLLSSYDCP